MVKFAIDIENARVISAMEELGISPDEIVIKKLEDFWEPQISPEIQRLRYDHYVKFLKNTIDEIKDHVKSSNSSVPTCHSKEANFLLSNFSSKDIPDHYRHPHKQRLILEQTLSQFTHNKEKPSKHKTNKTEIELTLKPKLLKNYKQNFKTYKDLQQENLKNIQKSQIKSQIELSVKSKKMIQEALKREKSIENMKKLKAELRESLYQKKIKGIQAKKAEQEENLENDIQGKLEKFNTKIKKSESLYNEAIKEKLERVLKFKEKSETVQKNLESRKKTNDFEAVQKLVEKHENVKTHRDRIDERLVQAVQTKREKFEKNRENALDKIRKNEEACLRKSKSAEKQLEIFNKKMSEKKEKFDSEMELKREMKRLKDLESLAKVQRAKRIHHIKNSKSLQRTLEKYQKIEDFKQEREKIIYDYRDSAIKAMIEKEKFLEAVAVICKSPRSRTAKFKLKALSYKGKDDSIIGKQSV